MSSKGPSITLSKESSERVKPQRKAAGDHKAAKHAEKKSSDTKTAPDLKSTDVHKKEDPRKNSKKH